MNSTVARSESSSLGVPIQWRALAWATCIAVTLLAAAVPFLRAFCRVEVDYNEGWNIYNAATVAAHGSLYPAKYGWTSVNYPMLSFVIMAQLHRLTHEYLFTARVVSLASLLASAAFVGAIVRRIGRRAPNTPWGPAILAALFTIALFCANADYYVGMDDPQMLAQVFFLAGLYLYVRISRDLQPVVRTRHLVVRTRHLVVKTRHLDRSIAVLSQCVVERPPHFVFLSAFCRPTKNGDLHPSRVHKQVLWGLALVATLFVVAGFIKHNPIDFPLAVLLDLLLISRKRAAWFAASGLALTIIGVIFNTHFGGSHFIDQLLAPRSYSIEKAALSARNALGPILLPLGVAVYAALRTRRDKHRRITAIFLLTSLLLGAYFGGGNGVSVNSFFSVMIAISILVGHLLDEAWQGTRHPQDQKPSWAAIPGLWIAVPLFLWLLIPLQISGNWRLGKVLRDTRSAQADFDRQVAELKAAPGPALCESLLICYQAGKPYLFDPFNATRLVQLGKLDQRPIVRSIEEGRYGSIQLDVPLGDSARIEAIDPAIKQRFTPEMLAAIERRYQLLSSDQTGAVYLPSRAIHAPASEAVLALPSRVVHTLSSGAVRALPSMNF